MAPTSEFIHLHNHTQYSLLDGACRIERFVDLAKQMGFHALAITDHGNMFGAIEFYKAARKAGIKPIIGTEAYVAPKSRELKQPVAGYPDGGNHLLLLAKNKLGYQNLIQLSTIGFLEGFYHRPRIDKEALKKYSEGLICTSACLQGEVAFHLRNNNHEEAKRAAFQFADIFGKENFYIEIQDHAIDDEDKVRPLLLKLARENNFNLVATNDCHYLQKEHHQAHDVLLCIQTGKQVNDADRMRYTTDQLYVKTVEEMKERFGGYPNAIENTLKIAEECNVEIELGVNHLPAFPLPKEYTNPDEYLTHLSEEGLRERYPNPTPEIRARLDYELGVIKQMTYAGYFLIVQDFTRQARDIGVSVGPGRGSAAGSIVSYVLGITNIDPVKYDLLFERFLNPERISMPDIDIDFSDRGRDKIIQYVIQKYGQENVGQIITFGTMAARAVVRDVGRTLGVPYGDVDKIAKLIPFAVDMTIERALQLEPQLTELAKTDSRIDKLLEYSKILEGLTRHASTHAAGVVIAPSRLTDYVPLYKGSKDEITTQWDMKAVEEIGLLKMDFLGLRTLTVLDDTQAMVKSGRGIDIVLDQISLDDRDVYKMFGGGYTIGIFQFESSGMREYLRKLKPENLNDLAAMNALYRPGPLKGGVVDLYIDRKHGREKTEYVHPLLESILKETYGVIVFQEQAIKIASEMAGYSLGKADILRKAMGKKNAELMRSQKEEFTAGSIQKGIDKKTAEVVFDLIDKFAGYGFNKSHSVGYALLAYQTAYLKTHFPEEFMAANMTSEMISTERIIVLMEECRRMGIAVLPPDVNESQESFTVVGNKIRFALTAVKNVGEGSVQAILAARNEGGKFSSLCDLTTRVELNALNRRALESLTMSGSLDSLAGNRAQLFEAIEGALNFGQSIQRKEAIHQVDLFALDGAIDVTVQEPPLPKLDEWNRSLLLQKEKEALGFYVSGHPLEKYRLELAAFASVNSEEISEQPDGADVSLGGIVQSLKINYDKQGRQMAFITLEDFLGVIEILVFADLYEKSRQFIHVDARLLCRGRVSTRENERPKLIGAEIVNLEGLFNTRAAVMEVFVNGSATVKLLQDICLNISSNPGPVRVQISMVSGNQLFTLAPRKLRIMPEPLMIDQLEKIVGKENISFRKSG
jgi:DNA polymerase-3 subunit alpha